MQDEIFFDGVRYLSAADAARSSSFTRDYIARLCKDGILVGRKIGKGWYVKEDSLNEFLVIKTAGQAQRRINLAHERSHEYRLRTEARQAFPEAERGYDVHHALARAVVRSASVMPAGALDLAVRAIPSPHTASATATFLQKAMALFFAVALTFGTYTAVDPQYMRDLALNTARASTAVVASMRNIATQGMFAHTEQSGSIYTAAVGATGVSGALRATVDSFARSVYERVNSLAFSIAFPERLFGVRSGERATVAVGITSGAKAQEVLASASSSPAQARAARTFAQTIVHQPVIQTVLERQSVVGGVSQEELGAALNILENKLSTRVYSLTAANSTQVADTYHVVAQTNRIDQLSRVSISDSNWTGGSISGASVSATNLAVSGVSGLATTTIGGALTITSGTASTNPFVVNNTLGTTVFAVANDGTLITNVASTTSSYSSLLVTGSATATNLVVLDTASSTNIFATNSTTTNATTTNLYASAFVSTNATTTNGYVENFVAQNATTTTLFSLNASTTNATSTNLYATLGHLVTGIIDSLSATVASITNITAINSTTTNATSTNLAVFTAPIAPAFIATSTTDTSVFNGNLTVGGTANFSGLLSFSIASTSQLSVFNKAYFGATATSTFDSAGNLSLVSNGLTVGANQLVASGGNIGIGITSPTSTLSVGGTTTIAFSQTDSASAATNFHGATYLGLGGQEYNPNSYRLIGFGYNNALSTNYYPAYMGYTETNSTGQTQGDLLFFTRNTTLGTASPTERLRVTASGTIGIGTTTPATTLSVQGNQYTSGTAFFGGAVTATSTFTTTATSANTFPFASTTAITSTTASTTALNISGTTILQSITASSLLYNNASQQVGAATVSGASGISFAAGTLSLSAIPNTSLANSTISGVALGGTLYSHAHDSTLTGTSYNGSAAVSDWGLNLANANTWTALQSFANASTSALSAYRAYFGATATSTFDSAGNLSVVSNGLTVGTSQLVVSGGNVGVGTSTPFGSLAITKSSTALHNATTILSNVQAQFNASGGAETGTIYGYKSLVGQNWGTSGGTVYGYYTRPQVGDFQTLGTYYGLYIDTTVNNSEASPTSVTVTNLYGVYSADVTAKNYFAGNVGIGTTTPGSLLSIGDTTGWNFYDNGTTTSYAKGINLKNGGCFAVNGTCISGGSGTNYWTLSGSNLYNNSGTYIGIGTTTPWGLLSVNPNALGSDVPEFVVGSSTATHLIVTGAGKVGIGTSTPSGNLSIVAAASSWGGIKGYSSTRTNGFFMDFFSASTTIAYNGKVGGFVLNDDQNSTPGLVFKSYDQSFPILFATSHGGGAETTRMAITNSGNVGIGTTSPGAKLEVDGGTNVGIVSKRSNSATTFAAGLSSIAQFVNTDTTDGNAAAISFSTFDTTNAVANVGQVGAITTSHTAGSVTGALTFFTRNSGTLTEKMRVDSSGNVGIGTTTPWAKLSVHANNGETNTTLFTIASSTASATTTLFTVLNTGNVGIGTTGPGAKLDVQGDGNVYMRARSLDTVGSNIGYVGAEFAGGSILQMRAGLGYTYLVSTGASDPLLFGTNTTERMRITSAGNVGIGTTTPQSLLSVGTYGYGLGQTNAALVSSNDQQTLGLVGVGSTNINFYTSATTTRFGIIKGQADGSGSGGAFALWTSNAAGTITERMRIDSSGNVGIGTTTPFRLLSLTAAVSTAQTAIAYDTTNNTDILTSSVGDLFLYPSGNDALFNNANLWVCTGGSGATNGCPSGTPSGFGNLIVETALGVGSSTPFTALALGANMAIVTTEKALTDGATIAISWKDGNQQVVTLGGNRAITFSNYIPGSTLRLVLCQDGTGSRTITSWPAAVLWSGGTAPTLTTTANKCDVLTFLTTAATGTVRVLGSSVLNF